MVGKIVDELPRRIPHNLMTDIDWEASARLAQENPGKAVLAATHVTESRAKSVRKRAKYPGKFPNPPFLQHDGQIVVSIRNSAVEEDGIRYGDVYFTWSPSEEAGG